MNAYKKIFLMILLTVAVIFNCNVEAAVIGEVKDNDNNLKISMLNIGHGDAILIRTKSQTILIDTANVPENARLISELKKLSVTRIDKLIFSHPHADHIGGSILLTNPTAKDLLTYPYLKKISVGRIYDNGIAYASGIYRGYMRAAKAKHIPLRSLKSGDVLDFGGGVKFNVIFPTEEFVATANSGKKDKDDIEYNLNNGSMVAKLTYKKFSMMFTGDCQKDSELKIVASNNAEDLKCDVLKAGHHGSYTSSTKEFVETLKPSCVLISSADDKNDPYTAYVHPNLRVVKTYLASGVETQNLFCTRWNGTITVTSDGKNFSVQPEKRENWVNRWIAVKTAEKKNANKK